MGRLWTPPNVSDEHRDSTAQFDAEIQHRIAVESLGRVKDTMGEWNHMLKEIDPRLEIARVGGRPEDHVGTPLKAGYWHVIRRNEPPAPMTVMVVEDEHGNYAEPGSQLLEKLREGDLWNDRNMERMRKARERLDVVAQRQKIREREDRQAEALERWKAVSRTQISMNRDTPWSQNQSGARAAKGHANGRKAA